MLCFLVCLTFITQTNSDACLKYRFCPKSAEYEEPGNCSQNTSLCVITHCLVCLLSGVHFPNMQLNVVAKGNADVSDNSKASMNARVYNLCFSVFSRLQGDSLLDRRPEEERRTRTSEQAVPDISCRFENAVPVLLCFFLMHFCHVASCLMS